MNHKLLRRSLVVLWLLVPTALLAWHFGPGQERLAKDMVQHHLSIAKSLEGHENWSEAVKAYEAAIAALPADETQTRNKLRLAHAKAQMRAGDLPEAMEGLEGLLAEMEKSNEDPDTTREVRSTQAAFRYYAAWIMRLEGASSEEWTEQVDQSRQHFRLLAEKAQSKGQAKQVEDYEKNLEAAVRLARMDLSELKAKPLPKECQGCKDVSGKCRSQKEGKCKSPGKGEKDIREKIKQDSKGATMQGRPEGTGS
jgi:hypothetical protein